jgi:hypothetical protein
MEGIDMRTLGFAGREEGGIGEEGGNRRGMGRKGGRSGVWEDTWTVVIRDYGSLVGDDEAAEKEVSIVCSQNER